MNVAEGYASLTVNGVEYPLTPSFGNMAKLGNPKEIIRKFTALTMRRLNPVTAWLAAIDVLVACGVPEELLGGLVFSETKKRSLIKQGVIPIDHVFILADHCMVHGLCGSSDQVRESKESGEDGKVDEFDPYVYVVTAMEILGITAEEAERLTMTKFIRMVDAKLKLSRKKSGTDVKDLTKTEVSDIMAAHRAAKAKRAQEQMRKRGIS